VLAAKPNISMPVLQLHGLDDMAVHKERLRDTWDWIDADYTLVTIPHVGHWVQRDAAELVTTTMRWWLLSRLKAEEAEAHR
jgi:pimeloyl-ACP methyl ester carboxylesterase